MGSIQPLGNEGTTPYRDVANTTTLQKSRVEYNPHTKTFGPKEGGITAQIDHMVNVEQNVAGLQVPTDFTSPTLLSEVNTTVTSKGTQLKADTTGVGAFFSGDATLYPAFISSIASAA